MANVQRIVGDVAIVGSLDVSGGIIGQNRSGLDTDTAETYMLPIQTFRVWDAFQTALGSAAADDLGIATGTFGTGLPYITTGDVKAAGAVTRYARTLFTLPPEYVSGGAVSIRFASKMVTTVADVSATIDAEVYKSARDTLKTGSDLVTTAATTINSLTAANRDFELSSGGLAPGDVLDIRVAIATNDAATATVVTCAIAHAEVILDIKG